MTEAFLNALARIELALARALERVSEVGTSADIERLVKLMIKKKIVTEMLLETIQSVAATGNLGQTDPVHGSLNGNQPQSQEPAVNTPVDIEAHQINDGELGK